MVAAAQEGLSEQFARQGWIKLPHAFPREAAAAMADATWNLLRARGIHRDDPATWNVERPSGLQPLRHHPAFAAVGSAQVISAVSALLGTADWPRPANWGSAFLAFPTAGSWALPASGWHIDANYCSPVFPVRGVKVFSLFSRTGPEEGGTLFVGGSHRLVHEVLLRSPPPAGASSADVRRQLLGHAFFRALNDASDPDGRRERLMHSAVEHEGISLRLHEMIGEPGDVYLLHPLVLHVAASNIGRVPRFLLSGGVTLDQWGWQGKA